MTTHRFSQRSLPLAALALVLCAAEARAQDAARAAPTHAVKPHAVAPHADPPQGVTPQATKQRKSTTRPATAKASEANRSAQIRRALAPYGRWVEQAPYGEVWVPDAGEGFVPFVSNGYWSLDDTGDFAWVSDHGWGDLVFHHGDWIWNDQHGWAWVPGDDYAPARVVWRFGDDGHDYVGWAPSAPARYWLEGAPARQAAGKNVFFFVPRERFFRADLSEQIVKEPARNAELLKHSQVVDTLAHPNATASPASDAEAKSRFDALLDHLVRSAEQEAASAGTENTAQATPAAEESTPSPTGAGEAAKRPAATTPPEKSSGARHDLALYRDNPYDEVAMPAPRTEDARRAVKKRVCRYSRTWPRRRICYLR